jgi:hypothetical protein
MAMSAGTVRVDPNGSGYWQIEVSGQDSVVTCETLDEAQRVAYLVATRRQPCELIVRDAYHRVLHHQLIDTDHSDDSPRNAPKNVLLTASRGTQCG